MADDWLAISAPDLIAFYRRWQAAAKAHDRLADRWDAAGQPGPAWQSEALQKRARLLDQLGAALQEEADMRGGWNKIMQCKLKPRST